MLELVAAFLLVQDSTPLAHLKWLLRHQREDGAWSHGPIGCDCAKDQPTGKDAERDPLVEKRIKPLLEALKSDDAEVRERAMKDLVSIGQPVESFLREGLASEEATARDPLKAALRRVVQARVPGDQETTALALLAILGSGHSHLSAEKYEGRAMGPAVKKAFIWILKRQKPSGLIGDEAGEGIGLSHALATLALCEAYACTASNVFKQPCLNALDYLVGRQQKSGAFGPGRDDAAVSLWCVLILRSAQVSHLEFPKEVQASLTKWLVANSGKGRDTEAAGCLLAKSLLDKEGGGLNELAERLAAAALAKADPFQRAAFSVALLHHEGVNGDRYRRWKKNALPEWNTMVKDGCERGSCPGSGAPARLTSLNCIALEGLYVYSWVLGSPKTRDWPPSRDK